jgi:hypothetical protein
MQRAYVAQIVAQDRDETILKQIIHAATGSVPAHGRALKSAVSSCIEPLKVTWEFDLEPQ